MEPIIIKNMSAKAKDYWMKGHSRPVYAAIAVKFTDDDVETYFSVDGKPYTPSSATCIGAITLIDTYIGKPLIPGLADIRGDFRIDFNDSDISRIIGDNIDIIDTEIISKNSRCELNNIVHLISTKKFGQLEPTITLVISYYTIANKKLVSDWDNFCSKLLEIGVSEKLLNR